MQASPASSQPLQQGIGPQPGSICAQTGARTYRRPKADYSKKNSAKILLDDPEFAAAFSNAKERIRRMELRFVEEKDPLRQALLEIYVSFVLKTPYNDFDTH
jgi:hypothetical protein